MRRTLLLSLLPAVLLVAVIWGPRTAVTAGAAQGASPEASSEAGIPITPAPVECTVEPRAVESLVVLLGTPVVDGAPAAEPSSLAVVEVPVGEPADEEVAAGITASVRELQACFNAGDSRRALALVTDDFLRDFARENALTAEDIASLTAGPEPVLAEAQSTILAVTDITMLADGRAGAFVVTTNSFSGPDTTYMVFVQQGERWLLDEVIPFLAA